MAGQLIGSRARQILLLALVITLVAWVPAMATDPADPIVRVEEDWELVVGTPDAYTSAPQVTCVMSPRDNTLLGHATFVLNHQSLPVFAAGGLQLQSWIDELPISDRKFPNADVMSTSSETVTWTQKMTLDGRSLEYDIVSGTSTTWGTFGGEGYLKFSMLTVLEDLDGYDPAVSAANSGVGYAGNRVQSLVLKRVRRYTASGAVLLDETPRTVHTTVSP